MPVNWLNGKEGTYMKKKSLLVLLVLMVAFSTAVIANAASGLCEIYWMTSTTSGGSGVGPGGTESMQASLKNIGYDAKRYQDTNAYNARKAMNSDVVFAIITHGGPGRVVCDGDTTISANNVSSDSSNYSLAAFYKSGDFSSMKFAYYGSCEGAQTDDSYGNLLSYTTSTLGAASALGFYNSVSDTLATYFEQQLFQRLSSGDSVSAAASAAKVATYNKYSSYGEVDSYKIYGDSSTKIK